MQVYSIERQLADIERWQEYQIERASTINRPVELLVIDRLDNHTRYTWEYTVITQWPRQEQTRACQCCGKKLPLRDFDRVKYTHDGLSWWCSRCRKNKHRMTWKDRVAEVQRVQKVRMLPKAA